MPVTPGRERLALVVSGLVSRLRVARGSAGDDGGGGLRAIGSSPGPIELFLTTRFAIWLAVIAAFLAFDVGRLPAWTSPDRIREIGYGLEVMAQWDVGWLLGIAEHGYLSNELSTAFFPLYPVTVGAVGRVLGGHYLLAGVIVSLVAGALAFRFLDRLGTLKVGRAAARRALLYLALFPTSVVLGVPYTESLYLMVAVGAFLFAEQGRLQWAGVFAGWAVLTRSAGVAVLVGLVVICWPKRRDPQAATAALTAFALAALYPLFLWWKFGSPLAFLDAQRDGWQRKTTSLGPLEGIWRGLDAGFAGLRQLIAGPDSTERFWDWAPDTSATRAALLSVFYAVVLLVLLVLALLAFRVLGPGYGVFALGSLLIPLSAPQEHWPLLSLPRFALGMFPIFLVLGAWRAGTRTHAYLLGGSTLLLGLIVCQWATLEFVF